MVEATASVYLHLVLGGHGQRHETAVIQPANGREIRVPVGVLIFNLNVLLTYTASRFVHFLRPNETNVLVAGPNVIGELLYLRVGSPRIRATLCVLESDGLSGCGRRKLESSVAILFV